MDLQDSVRALKLTSLKFSDVDFLEDELDYFIPEHDVGGLEGLRCLSSRKRMISLIGVKSALQLVSWWTSLETFSIAK